MNYEGCLFCGGVGPYTTENHLLPHSLGGASNMVLPAGITCDKCNSYFGSKVESEALREFPLNTVRLFYSIPTKKGGCIKIDVIQGGLKPSGTSNFLGLDPFDWLAEAGVPASGQLRLIAEPSGGQQGMTKARGCLCRMLLKMGMELIALEDSERARSAEFASARETARAPRTGRKWTYIVSISPDWHHEISRGLVFSDYLRSVELSIRESEWGSAFVLGARGFSLMIPLFDHLPDPATSLWGPWEFYVAVTF